MNKYFRMLPAICAVGVISAALPAFGSELGSIHVTVPFAFAAGTTLLPAGDYTVMEESHVLLVRGAKASAFVIAIPGSGTESDKSAVTFRHTEKGYVLDTVYSPGKPSSVVPGAVVTER